MEKQKIQANWAMYTDICIVTGIDATICASKNDMLLLSALDLFQDFVAPTILFKNIYVILASHNFQKSVSSSKKCFITKGLIFDLHAHRTEFSLAYTFLLDCIKSNQAMHTSKNKFNISFYRLQIESTNLFQAFNLFFL